jgi:hypothetical protein
MSREFLKHCAVYRIGKTASEFQKDFNDPETRKCEFHVSTIPKTSRHKQWSYIEFNFCLASKGGGTTEVSLHISDGDFPILLEAIVSTKAGAAALKRLLSKMITRATKESKTP